MDRVDFSTIFMAEEESDVQLRLVIEESGQNLTFPAHGIVLRRSSVMFKTMIDGGHSNSEDDVENQKPVLELRIKGKLSAAYALARYFYTKKMENLVVDDCISLMKAADLYQITDLFVMCEKELLRNLRPNCACQIYVALNQTASKNFKSVCLDLIACFAFLIFTENHHSILDETTMAFLLKFDLLNVLDEDQALEALVSWGRARSALKGSGNKENFTQIIADLLPLIRWRYVKDENKFPSLYELAKEKKWLEASSSAREFKNVKNLKLVFAKELNLSKMKRTEEMSYFKAPGSYDLLTFTVDKDVLLIGFKLDIIRLKKTSWNQDVQLFCNNQELSEMKSTQVLKYGFAVKCGVLSNEIHTYRVEIEFDKPLLLAKSNLHVIEAKITTGHDIAFPEFSLKSVKLLLISTTNDASFKFHSKMLSLYKIYYFNA